MLSITSQRTSAKLILGKQELRTASACTEYLCSLQQCTVSDCSAVLLVLIGVITACLDTADKLINDDYFKRGRYCKHFAEQLLAV
jgi:hypothetical protein